MKSVLNTLIGVLLGLVLAGGIFLVVRSPRGESVLLRSPPTEEPLQVHITGAVVRPGVYDLVKGARVLDAVEAAGGFVAEADKNALNLAARVEDADKLDIPFMAGFIPEESQGFTIVSEGTPSGELEQELVDINNATQDELEKLPGIGPTLARNIVSYREDSGPFAQIEDIVNVSGIGSSTYAEIRDLITVGE
jgi:competence protein ComEA